MEERRFSAAFDAISFNAAQEGPLFHLRLASESQSVPEYPMIPKLSRFLSLRDNWQALFPDASGRHQFGGTQLFRRLPQTLQIVILAGFLGEDVHDEVHIVNQDPFRLLVALDMGRARWPPS